MAYWLCDQRRQQKSVPVMRFDPRFWTVNFPRPMMASVVTTGPESLRADAIFYRSDDLAGLIWDSADHWDHPLLAYETNRDYRRLTMKFRWRSAGIIPLDAVNGPTLTINGRDATGVAKSWYIRLWNYAVGTPEDAEIMLDFSNLQGGFLLPQEADPVFAGDIDQIFISLIPPGYTGLPGNLPAPVEAWVELTGIRCDGAGVMLDTGDVMMPEHDLKMATGYDDAYNQTPARLLRAVTGLGYREDIVHYVGMSHFMRLARPVDGSLEAASPGELCAPAALWHRNFFERAAIDGLEVVASLSYELFDAYCPEEWKQRASDGAPALTGWEPPSTLLSPVHVEAMGYLQAVARAFVAVGAAAAQAAKSAAQASAASHVRPAGVPPGAN